MTLQELEDAVRSLLDEEDVGGYFSSEEIRRWLNRAQYDIAQKANHLTDSVYMDTLDGEDRYVLPGDFIREFAVFFNGQKVEEITFEERNNKKEGYIIWRDMRELLVSPPPPDNRQIELEYYRKPEKMDGDEDEPEVPEHYQDLLTLFALYRALQKDEKWEQSQVIYQEYAQGIQLIRQEYARGPRRNTVKVVRR